MRLAAVDIVVLQNRHGEVVHVVTDPAEARRWAREDRQLTAVPMRVILRVGPYGVEIA